MFNNSILLTLLFLFFVTCESSDKTTSSLSDKSEEAFAKIDKKNNDAFTLEDRRKAFNKSVSSIEKKRNSLKNNVTYNGYGTNTNPVKSSLANSKVDTKKQSKKKKSIYNSSGQSNSQIYSAYSTN